MSTYMPTVLVVEDDPAMKQYLRERFHGETSVGVVAAESLAEAKQLIDSRQITITAVVADLFFEEGKTDVDNHLNDGLDLLNYCHGSRPDASQYVFSVFSDKDSEREKAEELNLPIKTWFQKAWLRPGEGGPQAPWASVERDLIELTINRGNSSLKERLRRMYPDSQIPTEAVAEAVRALHIPRRTYIQSLESQLYQIMQPIEVICTVDEEGMVHAYAPRFALVNDGSGADVEEALNDLGITLIEVMETLDNEREDNLHQYLRDYRDSLGLSISSKSAR